MVLSVQELRGVSSLGAGEGIDSPGTGTQPFGGGVCKNERKVSAGSGSRPDRAGATGSLLTSWLESIRSWEGRTRLAEIDVEGGGGS